MTREEEIDIQRALWLSMKHVGAARPEVRAWVRKGHLERHYKPKPPEDIFCYVPGLKSPNDVFYGEWVADTDWEELPNVKDAKGTQDATSENGIEQVTMTIDNIGMIEQTGNLGALFHAIERGYYSPQLGTKSDRGEPAGQKNTWYNLLKDKNTQIMIVCGYGSTIMPLHLGLIDKSEGTSRPDEIVLTIRNMGQFITDQDVFMDAKNVWVRDPITFADRVAVQTGPDVVSTANAKSQKPGCPPSFAVDGSNKTAWLSQEYEDKNQVDWIEFPLPAGRYIKFQLYPAFPDLQMFVSVYVTDNEGEDATVGDTQYEEGWVDQGLGYMPNTTIPFINEVPGIRAELTTFPITEAGQKILGGDGTKVRVWFRNLHKASSDNGKGTCYRCGVREVKIFDVKIPEEVKKKHWILVDDVTDIIKVVLQWCGFDEWEIETAGVRLTGPQVFDRSKKLIDIINWVKEQIGYIFYIKPPEEFDIENLGTDANLSMGIAICRQQSAQKQNPIDRIESVRDDNLLVGVKTIFDANVLPDSIRVRGKAVSDRVAAADPSQIHALGADRTKRFQASFRPVWARHNEGSASLRRPLVHYDFTMDEVYLCEVACLMIAFQAALESAKGEIEIPLWPLIHLDHQTLLYDRGTGMSTRIWVTDRAWSFVSGEKIEFKMTLGGSFLDVDNVALTREELEALLNEGGRMPDPIPRAPYEKVKVY